LRRFALAALVCALFSATLIHAQQVDVAVGGSTLVSEATPSDLAGFVPPLEKGGQFAGISFDYINVEKHRLGFNAETAWRYHKADYPYNGETYRTVFTDANALFQPNLKHKFGLEAMAGVGIASNIFNLPAGNFCSLSEGGCVNYTTSNHLMEDVSGAVRYRFWRRFFVRGEVHYYHIQNNLGFQSNNVIRVGVSIGHTWGRTQPAPPSPPTPPATPAPAPQ
jgi:hypothetical protein